jgi:hypothetical protein
MLNALQGMGINMTENIFPARWGKTTYGNAVLYFLNKRFHDKVISN